jgi:CPA2 family monovalent cation:H+ antiporter-2
MVGDFLQSLVIIFGISALVVFSLHRIKIPSLVGFLLAGVIVGPYGLRLVTNTHSVEIMAEIGVVLLLFTIGIEFSLARLIRMKKAVLAGGGSQVVLTIGLSAAASYAATKNIRISVFFGFLVALSSTAIVLRMLAQRGEIDSPHGRMMTGILIFQDLCVVPLMLIVPSLSGAEVQITDIALKMGKAVLLIAVVLLSARWIVPRLLHQVVETKSRELFITTVILLCLGIPLLTSLFGLSLALGAFLAGLMISESEYSHQATADILPFKESFMSLFFVSVGMLLDTGYMARHLPVVAGTVLLIVVIKVLSGAVSSLLAGSSPRTSLHAGLGLAQIGEFSFILAVAGLEHHLISSDFYQVFLSSSVITMMMTPFVLSAAPGISAWATSHILRRRPLPHGGREASERFAGKRRDHVIIIGFGLNGRNLARVLREADIPYAVLELNSDAVRKMKKKGEPIFYGDGTSAEILHKLGLGQARLLVVAISDPASARKIVSLARHENPGLHIIVRTRYLSEVDDLRELGADEVIPEEFETSVEIFSRVLQRYRFPETRILDMVDKVRKDSYNVLRGVSLPGRQLFDKSEWLPSLEIDGYRVPAGSRLSGNSIGGLQVRKTTGATIIAVRRGPDIVTNPEPSFRFMEEDIIIFTGQRADMEKAATYFRSGTFPDAPDAHD